MNELSNLLNLNWFSLLLLASVIILLVLTVINLLRVNKLKNNYKRLMEMLEKGENLNDLLNNYIDKTEGVSRETNQMKNKIENIEKNLEKCVQKVGIVRYNAYKNSSSDLCFAIALLDFEDNGVVINGIYSRDNTTTTYAKPIEHGKSKYILVKEEEDAIELAKHNGYKCYLEMKN